MSNISICNELLLALGAYTPAELGRRLYHIFAHVPPSPRARAFFAPPWDELPPDVAERYQQTAAGFVRLLFQPGLELPTNSPLPLADQARVMNEALATIFVDLSEHLASQGVTRFGDGDNPRETDFLLCLLDTAESALRDCKEPPLVADNFGTELTRTRIELVE